MLFLDATAGTPAPSGETVASDVTTGTRRSGVLSWLGLQTSVAPQQVDQGLPLLSAPLRRRVHVVQNDDDDDDDDDSRDIGDISFDTATEGDDEVSAVTNEMNVFVN